MNSTPPVPGSHRRTYQTTFLHPVSHHREWRAVRALWGKLGHIAEEPNVNLKVTRNGQILAWPPPCTKDVAETDELLALRHLLERAATTPPETKGKGTHGLLVIDHHEARIFHPEMDGAIPQQILPHEPDIHFRHTHNSKDFSSSRENPDPNSCFEPVAKALQATGQILIFGSGTGTSGERDPFIARLKLHHPELAQRIIGSRAVDEHHLIEDQLLAQPREFYANARRS